MSHSSTAIQIFQEIGRKQLGWGGVCVCVRVCVCVCACVCVSSKMIDHVARLRALYARFTDVSPGTIGLADSAGLLTHLRGKKAILGSA